MRFANLAARMRKKLSSGNRNPFVSTPTDKWGDPWLDPRIRYEGTQPDLAAHQRRNSLQGHNKCPHCGEENLRLGPSGPGAQNILCASCGSKFNDTGVFGVDLLRDCTNPIPEMDTHATHDHFGTVQPKSAPPTPVAVPPPSAAIQAIKKKNRYMS